MVEDKFGTYVLASIPDGKGKGRGALTNYLLEKKYQFPMGKVKQLGSNILYNEIYKYQFPMGKVKNNICLMFSLYILYIDLSREK